MSPVGLWVPCTWNTLSFLNVYTCAFHQICKVSGMISLNFPSALFVSSSGTPTTSVPIHYTLSHRVLWPFQSSAAFLFFLFLTLDHFHCPIFRVTDSFFWLLKSALNPMVNFLLHLYFELLNFFQFLFRLSVPLFIFFILFMYHFLDFLHIFISLNVFNIFF